MNKAGQDTGGAVVNVLAYKADHVAASEELKVLEAAARSKNCETPANWRSNSTIQVTPPQARTLSQSLTVRNRSALPTTLTDDSAIAAAAITGESRIPNTG